jgi:hypothetical protein
MKKKLQTLLGDITIPKHHVLNSEETGFSSSAYLTEWMCYMGQEVVFETAATITERLSGITINSKQIERVCHQYGEKIETEIKQAIKNQSPPLVTYDKEKPYYLMFDGSMVFTREEKWKEIKLYRMFKGADSTTLSKNRNQITASQYIAHLGNHKDFFSKVETVTDYIPKKIIIADGAKWIWNWVEQTYPDAVQILDFYHAKEHLCQFAALYFDDPKQKQEWISKHSLLLLNDKVEKVIECLQQCNISHSTLKQARDELIGYYKGHQHRMKYKTFKEKGWLIGSGAMEAAHRNVIQQRMKLSGQRWTLEGAQQVVNLRAFFKSNNPGAFRRLFKIAA